MGQPSGGSLELIDFVEVTDAPLGVFLNGLAESLAAKAGQLSQHAFEDVSFFEDIIFALLAEGELNMRLLLLNLTDILVSLFNNGAGRSCFSF